jgi:chemotaxis protein MotB
MARSRRQRRGHDDHVEEHENEERWLVSFADMMILLFCLFMVLYAISSVNTTKFEALQRSLQNAFSGAIFTGGKSVMAAGARDGTERAAPQPPLPSLRPLTALNDAGSANNGEREKLALQEENDFRALKRRIDRLAKEAGLQGRVQVTVRRRGLVVQLLTDKVFFDSGKADIKPHAAKLVKRIAGVIRDERRHPIEVEGHTDSQPISGSIYPSNWELSGARAGAVIRMFEANGVLKRRMSGRMLADDEPIASNSTAAGRSKNRRVEIVLTRIYQTDKES